VQGCTYRLGVLLLVGSRMDTGHALHVLARGRYQVVVVAGDSMSALHPCPLCVCCVPCCMGGEVTMFQRVPTPTPPAVDPVPP